MNHPVMGFRDDSARLKWYQECFWLKIWKVLITHPIMQLVLRLALWYNLILTQTKHETGPSPGRAWAPALGDFRTWESREIVPAKMGLFPVCSKWKTDWEPALCIFYLINNILSLKQRSGVLWENQKQFPSLIFFKCCVLSYYKGGTSLCWINS